MVYDLFICNPWRENKKKREKFDNNTFDLHLLRMIWKVGPVFFILIVYLYIFENYVNWISKLFARYQWRGGTKRLKP